MVRTLRMVILQRGAHIELDFHILHHELAHLLDDHDQPN